MCEWETFSGAKNPERDCWNPKLTEFGDTVCNWNPIKEINIRGHVGY
jgi:hypothetical protein